MRKRLCFCATLAAALAAWMGSQAAAQNLLDNPGFEDPITSNGAPFDDNWEGFNGGAGAVSANANLMPRTLKAFAKRFGLSVTDDIDGKDIPALAAAGDWEAIAKHCMADLELTLALARKLGVVQAEVVSA